MCGSYLPSQVGETTGTEELKGSPKSGLQKMLKTAQRQRDTEGVQLQLSAYFAKVKTICILVNILVCSTTSTVTNFPCPKIMTLRQQRWVRNKFPSYRNTTEFVK